MDDEELVLEVETSEVVVDEDEDVEVVSQRQPVQSQSYSSSVSHEYPSMTYSSQVFPPRQVAGHATVVEVLVVVGVIVEDDVVVDDEDVVVAHSHAVQSHP